MHKLVYLNELCDKISIKKNGDPIAKNLDKAGYYVTTLHGGKSQEQRKISLEGFRAKRYNVLVTKDVVGRGIDILDVAQVINYDMLKQIERYTHCIGRTRRAGKKTVLLSYIL